MSASAAWIMVVGVLLASDEPRLERFQYTQTHMGGAVVVTLYAVDEPAAETAAGAAFDAFARLEAIMSDYRRDSEVSRLAALAGRGPQRISPELYTVLARAEELSIRSRGAFDVTCGPVVALWRTARQTGQLPTAAQIRAARALTGYPGLRLDLDGPTASLDRPGMRIDLGGIAKGFACDEALRALRDHGVTRALVQAGGDMAASDAPPGTDGWTVQVRGLADRTFLLRRGALSTSGDTEQYIEVDGVRYSHIVDPRTGLGLTTRVQVTVLARDGLTSDGLATALSVVGEAQGRWLAERYGAEAVFLTVGG